jgi:hypothetical protein
MDVASRELNYACCTLSARHRPAECWRLGWIENDPQKYLVSFFKQKFELLQKNTPLVLQINPRILRAALVELNSIELQILCDVLLELTLI